jgi:hypothetical protein
MENLLKKGHLALFPNSMPSKLWITPHKKFILICSWFWTNITRSLKHPMDLPPSHGEHDHGIPLILGSQPPNVHPYRHPFAQKNEIEKIVQELLEARVICPSTSPYSSLMVMVLKKEGNCACV